MRKNQAAQIVKPNRREFLKLGSLAAAAVIGEAALPAAARAASETLSNRATANAMPTRNLGKTGCRVGIFSLGGQAALERGRNDAVAVPLMPWHVREMHLRHPDGHVFRVGRGFEPQK